jgi:hypothetical protein
LHAWPIRLFLCFRALLFSPQPRPLIIDLFRSRAALEAELLVLRHQINVLRRACPKKHSLVSIDRLILASVCRLFPAVYDALAIVRPDTVIRWHRKGFKLYWRWKSRRRCSRPIVPLETRNLIRQMSIENPLWGAPRIHGELLKLGIDVSQTSVAKYMVRRRAPPSQGWKTFLRNHADGIAAMDLFVVPTFSFRRLYGLLIMGHGRRQILWFGVAAHPTAEWIANQLTQAYWLEANSSLSDTGSRWSLWRVVRASLEVHGHQGSSRVSAVTLAKRVRRTADRVNPSGMR